ncbi:uncharacterized protein LOC132559243 [Ylistrum balloti]|uniref:uncharacterized protein LOC132559243 n=1 Tax=Ylistrum balloti TaxID=509963 RepID=UPI002905E6AF|nr:uncharacterized protein LOC132559243 [Ylistrum balloti]XP_060079843.1 uncharacterized protein LOC132559243 [Ylistrum balloti]
MEETRVIFSKKGLKRNGYTTHDDVDSNYHDVDNNYEDWEREYYSDEDDVFMEGPKMDKVSASKPLMHPRQRPKVKSRTPNCRCRKQLKTITCFLVIVLSLGSLMTMIIYLYNKHPEKTKDKNGPDIESQSSNIPEVVGCDSLSVEDVWVMGFPKLITESAFRLVDVNQDGVLDIILGFGTGADGYYLPDIVCDIYFNGTHPCFGGLMALEGATGRELWRHYSPHEFFGVNCNADLNKDGVLDCLAGGRANAFQAVSGRDGSLLWNFDYGKEDIMNLYTPQIIRDLDGDGTADILTMHGGDPLQEPGSKYRLSARIILFSGRTGQIIKKIGVPDYRESYYSPQLYTMSDGTDIVLFGTGGETHPGSLWSITLDKLYRGEIKSSRLVYTDEFKGIMTPPVLLDLTGDGVDDIVMAMFNSSVLAIDGATYSVLWNRTFPWSESYNTPAPGFYNTDDVPDFMVKYAHGPGFPIYYRSQTTVLDGRTGKSLLEQPMWDTIGAQASPLTISMEGTGNDIFLYWMSDCLGHEGEGGEFKFVEGTNVHEQSRADFCRLRFKSKGYSKILALSRNIKSPGHKVYYSDERKEIEKSKWINTSAEALDFLRSHPEQLQSYMDLQEETRQTEMERPVYKDRELEGEYIYNPPPAQQRLRTTSKKGPPVNIPYRTDSFPSAAVREQTGSYMDPAIYDDINDVMQNVAASDDYTEIPYYQKPYRNGYPGYDSSSPRYRQRGRVNNGHQPRRLNTIEHMRHRRISRNSLQQKEVSQKVSDLLHSKKLHHSVKRNNNYRKRKRRHVGPHDEDGLQRLLSTGTLAPTTLPRSHPDYDHSIDFVFATYWFFPAKTQVILPADQKCIDGKMAKEKIRFSPRSKYYGFDHDKYQHVVTQECLQASGHAHSDGQSKTTFQSLETFNPYKINMGQMTVYRLRLTCKCSSVPHNSTNQLCSRTKPFDQQQWSAYMGSKGDSHWKPQSTINKIKI